MNFGVFIVLGALCVVASEIANEGVEGLDWETYGEGYRLAKLIGVGIVIWIGFNLWG